MNFPCVTLQEVAGVGLEPSFPEPELFLWCHAAEGDFSRSFLDSATSFWWGQTH